MALCDAVVELADAVVDTRKPLSDREHRWIVEIRRIAYFRDIGRLDLWESAVNSARPKRAETITEKLLEEVEMLGLCNLYQAFQEQRTQQYYDRLVIFFTDHGVQIPASPDLSDW